MLANLLYAGIITSESPRAFLYLHDHGSPRASRRARLTSFQCLGSSAEEGSSPSPPGMLHLVVERSPDAPTGVHVGGPPR